MVACTCRWLWGAYYVPVFTKGVFPDELERSKAN
jgi:hypothetical protein